MWVTWWAALRKLRQNGFRKMCEETLKANQANWQRRSILAENIWGSEKQKDSSIGGTINTTLDLRFEPYCRSVFPEDVHGSMIIMDAASGDLLVLLSRPSFDPNIFLDPLSMESWK